MTNYTGTPISELHKLIQQLLSEAARGLAKAADIAGAIQMRDQVSDQAWQTGGALAPVPEPTRPPVSPVDPGADRKPSIIEVTPKPGAGPGEMPGSTPAVPVPLPTPPAITTPGVYVVRGIIATMWRVKGDEGKDPARMAGGRVALDGDGVRYAWASLPVRVDPRRRIEVRVDGGPWTPALPQMDTGPWRLGDRYYEAPGRRPAAESMKGHTVYWDEKIGWVLEEHLGKTHTCNGAGIDLTPLAAAWAKTGKTSGKEVEDLVQYYYLHDESLVVDVRITEPVDEHQPAAALTRSQALARARASLAEAITYELGEELPGSRSDCSGAVGYWLGYNRDRLGMNTDAIAADGKHPGGLFTEVAPAASKPGDCWVYGAGGGHAFGHVGMISAAGQVIHCSSGHPAGHAVQETSDQLFRDRGAIVVRYNFGGE